MSAWVWLLLAVLLTIAGAALNRREPFDRESFAWVSAHFATMARAFVRYGVTALHAVPVQNNPPLGNPPDAYNHWPPLFSIVLAGWFRIVGESEAAARDLMLLIDLALCGALFGVVRAAKGARAGAWSAFAYLVGPVFVSFGTLVAHLQLALTLMLIAVFAFMNATGPGGRKTRWAVTGLVAIALGTATSWEPVLAALGLTIVSWARGERDARRLALAYLGVAVATALVVIVNDWVAYPALFEDLRRTVEFRLGMGYGQPANPPIHTLVDVATYGGERPSPATLVAVLVKRIFQLGVPALIAVAGVLIVAVRRRDVMSRETAQLLAGVFLPWPLWFIGMSHHAYFHDYELLLAAPFGAAALGIAIDATTSHLATAPDRSVTRALEWLPWLVVPAILLTSAALQRLDQHRHPLPPTGALPYAAAIGALTPPDAVVLSPEISMVPVYYSRRHLIRGVTDDHWVEVALDGMKGVFPAGPTFLALPPDSLSRFRASLLRYPVVSHTEDVILLSLPAH